MISYEEAYEIVTGSAWRLETERVGLDAALQRALAEDVPSDMDMPPFDKSAMDGFACRREDLPGPLEMIEEIPAGRRPKENVGAGQCAKIMTGAPVPEGADCVIMVEDTEQEGTAVRFTGEKTRTNICYRGEDIREQQVMLRQGDWLAPQHIAVLASVGCAEPLVYRKARVGVIATGDELVEPHVKPSPSEIRTSNSPQLCAQVVQAGATATYYGIVADTEEATDAALKRALAENDVVLVSGGVSMGEYDYVPKVMAANGLDIRFDAIAMKPGKPTTFGVSERAICIGLPGNPVSTFIQFEVIVRPLLHKMMGRRDYHPRSFPMRLAEPLRRKRTGRAAWMPLRITEEQTLTPLEYHGSAHIHALCQADVIVLMPAGVGEIEKGTIVDARPIRT